MKTANKTMIKGIPRRILALLIAVAFLLNVTSPALAGREGNYGENNSFSMVAMGTLAGVVVSPGSSWQSSVLMLAGTTAAAATGLYLYVNNYEDYGKPMIKFNIGGAQVDISKGQLYSMVASTVACALANMATQAFSTGVSQTASQLGRNFVSNMATNSAVLLASETVKDVLHDGFGLDMAFAEIAGLAASVYVRSAVRTATLTAMLVGNEAVTADGNYMDPEGAEAKSSDAVKAAGKTYEKEVTDARAALKTAIEANKGDEGKINTAVRTANFKEAQAKAEYQKTISDYVKTYGHSPSEMLSKSVGTAVSDGLGKIGTGPLINAGGKILALLAMNYTTYYGKDKHSRLNNSVKMAIATGVGAVLSSKYGSENVDSKGQSRPWLDVLAYGAGSAATDVAWQYFLHSVGINSPNGATELVRLAAAGATRGLLNKGMDYDAYFASTKLQKKEEGGLKKENKVVSREEFNKQREEETSSGPGGKSIFAFKIYEQYENAAYNKYLYTNNVLTREEYSSVGNPKTVGEYMLNSVVLGMRGANPVANQINMEYFVSSMARGKNALQAMDALLYSSFHYAANSEFGSSTATIVTGKQTNISQPITGGPGEFKKAIIEDNGKNNVIPPKPADNNDKAAAKIEKVEIKAAEEKKDSGTTPAAEPVSPAPTVAATLRSMADSGTPAKAKEEPIASAEKPVGSTAGVIKPPGYYNILKARADQTSAVISDKNTPIQDKVEANWNLSGIYNEAGNVKRSLEHQREAERLETGLKNGTIPKEEKKPAVPTLTY